MNKDTVHPGLAKRVATATTRLILIAIVAGGLFSVALNVWWMRRAETEGSSAASGMVAPLDDLLQKSLPVIWNRVQGDEGAARNAVVHKIRAGITTAVSGVQTRNHSVEAQDDPFKNAVELARDPLGLWSVHQIEDVRSKIVGVMRTGPEPTVLFWGGYDETGPGEWTTWTMQLPSPKE